MDKPSNERGNTGSTDGIRTGGDAGNERHACKANPAMIDDIGKKHGLEDTSENFSGKKYALAPKAATKFLKASRCYVALGKARRVLYGGWDYCCFHQHLFCGRNGAPMAMMIL